MLTGEITYSDRFEMKDVDIRMVFNNSIDEAKSCGATTVLEVYGYAD